MTDRSVELRSDTFTRPSPEMRRAMAEAEVGDDVWNEDPTVQRLESSAAEITGKEAALFVTSGTQGNLVGLLTHTRRGDEVILGEQSHLANYETAGAAIAGGLQIWTLPNRADGSIEPERIRAAIRSGDIHEPRTGCIAIENTHNRCGGAVLPASYIADVAAIAHEHGIPFHLDGARIFNAAAALGTSVARLAAPVDSITFCISKGLGAPVGSLLCGSVEYVERARKWRKVLGGGMRQVGILAAAGLYALEHNVDRLAEDHRNARALAEGLAAIPGVELDLQSVQSNIVNFRVDGTGISPKEFCAALSVLGVRVDAVGKAIRAVTSMEVTRSDIDFAIDSARQVAGRPIPAAV
jgi:threonine aldolase